MFVVSRSITSMSSIDHDLIDKFDEVEISKKGGMEEEEALFDKKELQLEEHIDEGFCSRNPYIEARNRKFACLHEAMKALSIDQAIEDFECRSFFLSFVVQSLA